MSQFSAQEPSLGYHYQIRYALYLLLKAKEREAPFVKLENLDDVEISDINKVELHQTKFHNKRAANLTDASPDIWKTLRIWSDAVIRENIELDNVVLVLLTTSEISQNSILHELTENKLYRINIQEIVKKLNAISKSSSNKDLKTSFETYSRLTEEQKYNLINSIRIKDNGLDFDNLKKSIKSELQLTFLPEQIHTAYHDLEGWWYEQCIQHLQNKKDLISFAELRSYISYLNDKYKSDNLPIDNRISDANIIEDDFEEMVFVKQLKKVNLGKNVISQAKRDYYRANEQRSKWIREQLSNPEEQYEYDSKLKDDWRSKFVFLQDLFSELSDENLICDECRKFYTNYYGMSHPKIFIRPKVDEAFIVKGSCHMLADKQDIVWHPIYLKN